MRQKRRVPCTTSHEQAKAQRGKKMALAAHLAGIVNALALMALGLAWGLLTVSPLQARLTRGAFLYGTYANWVTSCLAAAWGTSPRVRASGALRGNLTR